MAFAKRTQAWSGNQGRGRTPPISEQARQITWGDALEEVEQLSSANCNQNHASQAVLYAAPNNPSAVNPVGTDRLQKLVCALNRNSIPLQRDRS